RAFRKSYVRRGSVIAGGPGRRAPPLAVCPAATDFLTKIYRAANVSLGTPASREYSGLLEPGYQKELGRVPHVGPDADLAVGREEDVLDGTAGAGILWRNLLPQLSMAGRGVEAVDPRRHERLTGPQLVGAANVQEPVGRGLDGFLSGKEPDNLSRLAAVADAIDRIEGPLEGRTERTNRPTNAPENRRSGTFRRDGSGLSTLEILHPDAPSMAPLDAREQKPPTVWKEGRARRIEEGGLDSSAADVARLARSDRNQHAICLPGAY